jgi:hypothetical protein
MRKTLVRKILSLFVGVIFIVGFAATAGATLLTWTDNGTYNPSAGGANPITYSLNFSPTGNNNYDATFTIATTADVGPPEWYAGWFLFKIDSAVKGDISNLSAPGGTGPWSIADDNNNPGVTVLKSGGDYQVLVQDGFSGFYVTSLAADGAVDDITQGLLLTGGSATYTFTFDFSLPEGFLPKEDLMPFQAAFYDGLAGDSGNIIVNQLSETLGVGVPDASVILLLGSSFLGFAVFTRKRKTS